jgi:hypothetical protein
VALSIGQAQTAYESFAESVVQHGWRNGVEAQFGRPKQGERVVVNGAQDR